jgi:tetratricopeptide (TPR) repeat protein
MGRAFYRTAVSCLTLLFLSTTATLGARERWRDDAGGWESLNVDVVMATSRSLSADLHATDLGALAASVAKLPAPGQAREFVRRLEILLRAGHRAQAARLVDETALLLPDSAQGGLYSVVSHLLTERDEVAIAKRIYERMPLTSPSYDVVERWGAASSPAEIDAWLAARAEQNPEWFPHRVHFRIQQGTEADLLAPFVDDIRAHPDALGPIIRLLALVGGAGRAIDVAWLRETCRLERSGTNVAVGASLFYGYAEWRPIAIAFLQRSLELPFTDEDAAIVTARPRASPLEPNLPSDERGIRIFCKAAIAEAYSREGRHDLAQPFIEDVVAMSGGSPPSVALGRLAGAVQAGSGMRVIERSIVDLESERQDSHEYWLARAAYYEGRNEHALAAETLRRALDRFPLDNRLGDGQWLMSGRLALLYQYASVDPVRAAELIVRDFNAVSLDGRYAAMLAKLMRERDMTDALRGLLNPREERLWEVLASRTEPWDVEDAYLVAEVVRGLTAPERLKCWAKASRVASSRSPVDRLSLAVVVADAGDARHAEPMLRASLRELGDGHGERWRAISALYEVLIQLQDWAGARRLFVTEGSKRVVDARYAFGEIAAIAASRGATTEAMALWKLSARVDRTRLRELDSLVAAGLGPRLREFYTEMKRTDPSSWVPDEALRRIGEK